MEALREDRIRALLSDPTLPVAVLAEADSTSSECRRRHAAGTERCLILAERQSAGRGRQGKQFFSPGGRGLYMSLMFAPAGGLPAADGFTAYAAVTAAQAIERVCGVSCGIKWVNDLYHRGKKVCGILTEAVGDTLIVGVGVDLLAGELPPELEDVVGALECDCDRNALAAALADGLMAWRPGREDFRAEYRARSIVLGRPIRFLHGGALRSGAAEELTADGGLVVAVDGRRIVLRSGEISLLSSGEAGFVRAGRK